MANWCLNRVIFQGSDDQQEQITDLFETMQEHYRQANEGQLPGFIQKDTDYFFAIEINEGVLSYITKWVPNVMVLCEIADYFGVSFRCAYEETGNGIFGEAVYQDGILRDIALEVVDFAKYDYDEETGRYLFEGESYKNDSEILELLLERRKHH